MTVLRLDRSGRDIGQARDGKATILVFPYQRMPHFVDRTARRITSYATSAERNQAMVEIITRIYEELSNRGIDDRLKERVCIDFSKAVWPVVAEFDRKGKA